MKINNLFFLLNIDLSISNETNNYLSSVDLISTIEISDVNGEEIEQLSISELDEILQYFPMNSINQDQQTENTSIDFDFQNLLIDSQTTNNDDLFVQMLLDNDNSSSPSNIINTAETETIFDDLFFNDILQSSTSSSLSTSLPRITSVDEFDAFLRDFAHNLSSYQHEVSTFIS